MAAFLLLAGILLSLVPAVTGSGSDTTSTSLASTTTTTLSDSDYERIAGGIVTLIDAAANQRCPLVSGFTGFGELPDPVNTTQVRAAIDVTIALLLASAASALADQPEAAQQINETAGELAAEAEAAGHEPDWLNTPPGNQALANPAFVSAFEDYQALTEQLCLPGQTDADSPGATVAPDPGDAPG